MARENPEVSGISSPTGEGNLRSKKRLLLVYELLKDIPSPQMPSGRAIQIIYDI